MAERKKSQNTRRNGSSLGCLFWIAFLLVIVGLFLFNRELIRRTLDNTKFFDRVLSRPPAESPTAPTGDGEEPSVQTPKPTAKPVPAPVIDKTAPPPAEPIVVPAPDEKPALAPTSPQEKPSAAPITKPTGTKPEATKPQVEEDVPLRERTLWFVRLDDDGVIARTKTVRSLPASDSPLVDALSALLVGPSAAERKKGLSSLIPSGTRLLSAVVRGDTAYLSFSEDFQFNSYGIEGYAAQLRQIVWTATEFSNVETVQILIEGRRVDYLGLEGIWIGGPIGRDSL